MEKAEHKIDEDTMHIEKQGMIYRRGTSVAVNDLERELSFLLPNDDYHYAGGEARHVLLIVEQRAECIVAGMVWRT
jgi:hypothetical protein